MSRAPTGADRAERMEVWLGPIWQRSYQGKFQRD